MISVPPTPATITDAARFIQAGAIIVYPTDTVYGLGGDATNDEATEEVYRLKGRPTDKALPVLVRDVAHAERFARLDERARALGTAFWPGALSLVLSLRDKSGLSRRVNAGGPTIALRAPDHPVPLGLIELADCPLLGPSANPSGEESPVSVDRIAATLGDAVAMVLDAGPTPLGVVSTVLDLSTPDARILRNGAVSRTEIEEIIGPLVGG